MGAALVVVGVGPAEGVVGSLQPTRTRASRTTGSLVRMVRRYLRPVLRSAVYNRFWATGGGAEKFAGAIAQHLTRHGPVQLIAHEPVDLGQLGERLSLDLSGCSVREVPQSSAAVTEATAGLDLFVNASHRSRDVPAAARSLYVVHFPTDAPGPDAPVSWGPGVHLGDESVTWTDGRAVLHVESVGELTLALGFQRPPAAGPVDVRLLVDGEVQARTNLAAASGLRERITGRQLRTRITGPTDVVIESPAFRPADVVGGTDRRTLGVPVVGVRLGRSRVDPGLSMAWLGGYDQVVANSVFTQDWVTRRWGVSSSVLYPPVTAQEVAAKERVILGVGRFFAPGQGHQKKQRELVAAFRRLVDCGVEGWELHLVGGCDPSGRDYVEQVRRDADGYPVVLHLDASGAELAALMARATVFWHLAGLGEDAERFPERLEHFGISTAEAMSAAAVPVVLGVGGLAETVRDGVDGLHVTGVEDLAIRTRELIDDPARLARLSAAARERARELTDFDARLAALLERHGS